MTAFTDNFNRANSTDLGAGWVEVSGDWSIISNQLSSGSAGGTIILRAAGAMATSDHYAQVTIAATAAVSHGVWCRGNANITSGYLWRNDGTSWNLFSVVGGSFTSIGSYAAPAVAGDVAKVQAVGSTIKGFVNGIERVSVVNTAVATGTSVGLRAESTASLRFDDFAAADVTSGTTGDAALTGTAGLTAAGQRGAGGAAALTGTAALSAAGGRGASGDASLTATAGLTAGATRAASSAGSLTAAAGLTAGGARTASGDTSLAATAGLAADGARGASGLGDLGVAATLTAGGSTGTSGSAQLSATADLAASGQRAAGGDTALAAAALLAADGLRDTAGTGQLAAAAELTTQGQAGRSSGSALTIIAGLAADGATSPPETAHGADLHAAAVLTAAGTTSSTRAAALTGSAALTASGTVGYAHDDVDVTVGAPYSPWAAGQPTAPAWNTQAPRTGRWEVGAPW
ncbi:hypothetical protein [Streptomyces longwoodensis]|uniref:hypothetical protein n=1 Tax=Streptomyces longwoodensis TaxID=68231 RepID=UPI00380E2B6B